MERFHEELWVDVPGRPVRLLVSGAARDGVPPLVIVPGLGAIGYVMDLLHACGAWTRTFLLDVPGFGHRRTARCPVALETQAQVVTDVVAGTVGSALVFAHSTGSQIAVRVAATAPDLVRGLVLGGPTFDRASRRRLVLFNRLLRTIVFESPAQLTTTVPEYLRANGRLLEYVRAGLDDEPETWLARTRAPTLLLRGRRDALAPSSWIDELASARDDVRTRTLPGAHNFVYSHPGMTSLLLAAFARSDL